MHTALNKEIHTLPVESTIGSVAARQDYNKRGNIEVKWLAQPTNWKIATFQNFSKLEIFKNPFVIVNFCEWLYFLYYFPYPCKLQCRLPPILMFSTLCFASESKTAEKTKSIIFWKRLSIMNFDVLQM